MDKHGAAEARDAAITVPPMPRSTRPVAGPTLDRARRVLSGPSQETLAQVVAQVNSVVAALTTELSAARDEIRQVRSHNEALDRRETEDRTALQHDIAHIAHRLDQIELGIDRLQLTPRLTRLERQARAESFRTEPSSATTPALSAAPDAVGSAPHVAFDYFAFEARFRGSESVIRARQKDYLDVFAASRRVVDLGCGRGELIELLTEAGIDAYGVDLEPDFVDHVKAKGLHAVREDIQGHLNNLAVADVDGIIVSHVVEHLAADELYALVQRAAEVLANGGVLVVETPNPESLLAGSINFHRDPTHRRPVHPETLAFLCESAGFREAEIRRLAPVPASAMLPAPAQDLDHPLTAYMATVVGQLNSIIYGYQDYAVIARGA